MNNQLTYQKTIPAIILAAGKSERFGAPKVLQSFKNIPFLVRIVDSVCHAGIQTVYLVIGFQANNMLKKLPGINKVEIVINKDYEFGQFSSLQAGIRKLPFGIVGCLVCLIDQPHIRTETVKTIMIEVEKNSNKLIIPSFNNRGGHPVYIPDCLFPEIIKSKPTKSLRTIFSKHSDLIHRFEVNDPLIVEDIDTPDDLEKIEKLWK